MARSRLRSALNLMMLGSLLVTGCQRPRVVAVDCQECRAGEVDASECQACAVSEPADAEVPDGGDDKPDSGAWVDAGIADAERADAEPADAEPADASTPAPLVLVPGPAFDFGEHCVGTTTDYAFFLRNEGTRPLASIRFGPLTAPFAFKGGAAAGTGGDCAASLDPGQSCRVVLAFSPVAEGAVSAEFSVDYGDGASSGRANWPLSGRGEVGTSRCEQWETSPGTGWFWANPRPTGRSFNGVWGSASSDVWVVGDAGTILHWDGTRWARVTSGTALNLKAVAGSGASDVWAVGDAGTILHWDGSAWAASNSGSNLSFVALRVISNSEVWAVGAKGGVVRWDGQAWSTVSSETWEPVSAIWGSASHDLWVAGGEPLGEPAIRHWDGTTWSEKVVVPPIGGWAMYPVSDLWGFGSDDVWAAGSSYSLHWDGDAWSSSFLLSDYGQAHPWALWGSGPTDLWMWATDFPCCQPGAQPWLALRHWDGSAWATAWDGDGNRPYFHDMWGAGPSDIWMVGDEGQLLHWDGTTVTPQWPYTFLPESSFDAVWGAAEDDLWLVDRANWRLWHWDGSAVELHLYPQTLHDGWSASRTDAWATSSKGDLFHWNGQGWSESPSPGTAGSMWGSDATNVWAVGAAGSMLHWDGGQWSSTASNTTAYLSDIWGFGPDDVWAVGADGVLVHWDGLLWTSLAQQGTEIPAALWGSGPADLWAVGETILHWDGMGWSTVQVPGLTQELVDVWGTGPTDAWAVGLKGTILHWDGSNWQPQASGVLVDLHGIWGKGTSVLKIVGAQGTILERH